jgi:tetratricopeptide (TPR) repeat protein
MQRADNPPTGPCPAVTRRHRVVTVLIVVAAVITTPLAYLGYKQYESSRLARSVEDVVAARRYDEAGDLVRRWARERPDSADAQYYRAWLALVAQQPGEAFEAIEQAARLGCDPRRLSPLKGIYMARGGHINEAEPILREAFEQDREPRAEVAKELARIYLTTYRLPRAAVAIERWRALVPTDPQPYLWSNEVVSRSDGDSSLLIRNFRAALERDPNLADARRGLAEQLSKERRFDEADEVYREHLHRNPTDASALVGQGRDAFHQGDLDGAVKDFEAALAVAPRHRDALKELAQADLRLGRHDQACRRFELLIQLEPYDPEVHASYARGLELSGDPARARSEAELAARLRKEADEMSQLQYNLQQNPNDLASRFAVARWLLEHGRADEGLKWTKEIFRADPDHRPTHEALAEYYRKRGDAGLANYHRLRASAP